MLKNIFKVVYIFLLILFFLFHWICLLFHWILRSNRRSFWAVFSKSSLVSLDCFIGCIGIWRSFWAAFFQIRSRVGGFLHCIFLRLTHIFSVFFQIRSWVSGFLHSVFVIFVPVSLNPSLASLDSIVISWAAYERHHKQDSETRHSNNEADCTPLKINVGEKKQRYDG